MCWSGLNRTLADSFISSYFVFTVFHGMLYFKIPFDFISLFFFCIHISCHPDVFCFVKFDIIPVQKENVISGVRESVTMSVIPRETTGRVILLDYILVVLVIPSLVVGEWGQEAETFYYIPFFLCFEF